MSLINDALKRARDAERQRSNPNNHTPLQPADNPYRPGPAARWLILCLVAIVLLLSGLSFHKWARQPSPPPRAQIPPSFPNQSPLPSEIAPLPSLEPADPSLETLEPPNPSLQTLEPPNPSLETLEPPDPSLETSPEPAGPPEFRLQSIIFRTQKPAALINGEMLHLGETIGEARVTDIQSDAVTINWRDSNIVLRMPRF